MRSLASSALAALGRAPRLWKTAGALALSVAGVAGLQYHEGTVHAVYLDPVGIPTSCTGHTGKDTTLDMVGQPRAASVCARLLREDARTAERAVQKCVRTKITQQQYDAMVSLAFNIGGDAFCNSTLVRTLNAGDCRGAADQFMRWVKARGRTLKGLVTRRADERAAFLTGCV